MRLRALIVGVAVVVGAAIVPSASAATINMYGVTLDNAAYGTNLSSVYADTAYAAQNGRRLTERIVMDRTATLSDYTTSVNTLSANADLLALPVDSTDMSAYTVATYTSRFNTLLNMFPTQFQYWEVGNEINGSWLGDTNAAADKQYAAYQAVKAAGKLTWLTPIYEPNCWSQPWEDMIPWLQAHIVGPHPDEAAGLDYVMVSYYENDCNGHRISQAEFDSVFTQLHSMFPNAKLGWGEVGLPRRVGSANLAKAQSVLSYYYSLHPTDPALDAVYVRGGMWWYGQEDLFPRSSKPLWPTFWTAINSY